jgi:hypothetical protein
MKMDFERRRLWGKIIMALAFLVALISVPIAAARQTTYEWRCTANLNDRCTRTELMPVVSAAPTASAGLIVGFIGFLLGVAGFIVYIFYDLKVKTARHGFY